MSLVVFSNVLIKDNSLLVTNTGEYVHELESLQKGIYKATIDHDYERVHKLQQLLLSSRSVRLIVLLSIVGAYSRFDQSALPDEGFRPLLDITKQFSSMTKNVLVNSDHRTRATKLHNCLADQIIIADLNDKIMSNVVYLCLKPEWEAKLIGTYITNSLQSNHLYKINNIMQLCSQYYRKNYGRNKVYVLKNKVDILHEIRDLNYEYLKQKLNSIYGISKFIKKYLVLYSDDLGSNRHVYSSFSNLLYLLKNILIATLSEDIYLYNDLFTNIRHRRDVVSELPRFLWHDGYFVFFSSNKNEITYVQDYVTRFFTDIGLMSNRQDILIFELSHGFNFLDFYIKSNFKYSRAFSDVVIRPSVRSQLTLLKAVKSILYHKDQLYRVRPNAYLSFGFAVRKINNLIQRWKKYYNGFQIQDTVSLNSMIKLIIYKWQIKKAQKRSKVLCNFDGQLKFNNLL